jgi:hypothetical protein
MHELSLWLGVSRETCILCQSSTMVFSILTPRYVKALDSLHLLLPIRALLGIGDVNLLIVPNKRLHFSQRGLFART